MHRDICPDLWNCNSTTLGLYLPCLTCLTCQELEAAEDEDLPVSTPAYNAALKAFAIGKALQPGLEFFHDMKEVQRITHG